MKKRNRTAQQWEKLDTTVGIDVGDEYSRFCVVDSNGDVVERGRIRTTEAGFRRRFAGKAKCRIAFECGTHSPWMSRLLEQLGHQVIVANARKLEMITSNESKNDDNDAENLALLANSNPRLLSPIRHRSVERQQDLNLVRARDTLVRARTMIINSVRGLVKSAGARLPKCSTDSFASKVKAEIPAGLAEVTAPLLHEVEFLSQQIAGMDKRVEELGQKYPEIKLLRTAPGVGPVVAATYALTLDAPQAIRGGSRQVGAFLGLRPRQSQSGERDPELRISKTGNIFLRRLLVQSAQYVLGRFGPDSELRRWGLKLAGGGGKRAKKRAVVAVARKLAVILHTMWRKGDKFQAFPQGTKAEVA